MKGQWSKCASRSSFRKACFVLAAVLFCKATLAGASGTGECCLRPQFIPAPKALKGTVPVTPYGQADMAVPLISPPAPGLRINLSLSYTPGFRTAWLGPSGEALVPPCWSLSLPHLVLREGGGYFFVEKGRFRITFEPSGECNRFTSPRWRGALLSEESDTVTLKFLNGERITFAAFSSTVPPPCRGKPLRWESPYLRGDRAVRFHYHSSGLLERIEERRVRMWWFFYDTMKLSRVEVTRRDGSLLYRAALRYSGNGAESLLVEALSSIPGFTSRFRHTYFVYYSGEVREQAGLLAAVIGPVSSEIQAPVSFLLGPGDELESTWGSAYTYVRRDVPPYVVVSSLRQEGCSRCGTAGSAEIELEYLFRSEPYNPPFLIKAASPEGRVTELWYDRAGRLTSLVKRPQKGNSWEIERWEFHYDACGGLQSLVHPPGVAGDYYGKASGIDPLVERYRYDRKGRLTAEQVGRASYLKNPENAPWITKRRYKYSGETPFPSEVQEFPDPNGPPVTTGYSYVFSGPPQQLKLTGVRESLPPVPSSQNGSGTPTVREYHIDPGTGRLVGYVNGGGTATWYRYDPETGVLISKIQAPETLGLKWKRFCDPWGRVTEIQHPDGLRERTFRGILLGGRVVEISYPLGVDGSRGPVSFKVRDLGGRVVVTAKGVPREGLSPEEAFSNDAADLERAWEGELAELRTLVFSHGRLIRREDTLDSSSPEGEKAVRRLRYDRDGLLVETVEPDGTVRRFTYDYAGRLRCTYETHVTSKTLTLLEERVYDDDGRLASVAKYRGAPAGCEPRRELLVVYRYDWRGRITEQAELEENSILRFAYDNLDRLVKITRCDPARKTEELLEYRFYDSRGRLWKHLRYDRTGRVPYRRVLFWYDASGRLAKRLFAGGVFEKRRYDAAGRLTELKYGLDGLEAEGAASETYSEAVGDSGGFPDEIIAFEIYRYDAGGRITLQTHRAASHEKRPAGEVHADSTEALCHQAAFWYDSLGRLSRRAVRGGVPLWGKRPAEPPDSKDVLVTSISYDAWGHAARILFPDGGITSYRYDSWGRPVTREEGALQTPYVRRIERTYDAAGRVTEERFFWRSNGVLKVRKTRFEYGVLQSGSFPSLISSGRFLARVLHPDPLTGEPGTGKSLIESYAYDAQGRVIRHRRSLPGESVYTEHSYRYDTVGRLVLDSLDQTLSQDQEVRSVVYGYDTWGRLVRVAATEMPGGGGKVLNEIRWNYDVFDRPVVCRQEHEGEVRSESASVRYRWSDPQKDDLPGRLLSLSYPGADGLEVRYEYGGPGAVVDRALGRVRRLFVNGKLLAAYNYSEGGRVTQRDLYTDWPAFLLRTRYTYDGLARIKRLQSALWCGEQPVFPIDDRTYTYDRAHRIILEDQSEAAGIYGGDQLRLYDSLGRLVTAARGTLRRGFLWAAGELLKWEHDATGNWERFRQNGRIETRSHDRLDRLIRLGADRSFAYDAAGNMVEGLGLHLKFDGWGRLVRAELEDGTKLRVVRDGLGRPIREIVERPGSPAVVRRLYYRLPWQLLTVYQEEAGRRFREDYVWGPGGEDELLFRRRVEAGRESSWLILQDALHNVSVLLSSHGLPVERYAYGPYGRSAVYDSWGTKVRTDSPSGMPFGFQCRREVFPGILDFRYRAYAPDLGRFLQRDPLGIRFQGNLYAAPFGSSFTDPYGLAPRLRNCENYAFDLPKVRVGAGLILDVEFSFNARTCDCCNEKENEWIEEGYAELNVSGSVSLGFGFAASVRLFGTNFGILFQLYRIDLLTCKGKAVMDSCSGTGEGCVRCGSAAAAGIPLVRVSNWFGSLRGYGRFKALAEVFFCFKSGGITRGFRYCYGWNARVSIRLFWFHRSWDFGSKMSCRTIEF